MMWYTLRMVKTWKHKGLELFFRTGKISGIQAKHKNRLRIQLAALDTAITLQDMNVPGFRLHRLKGDRAELWAVDVSQNWRLVFRFEEGHAYVVNYEDYH